MTSAPVPSTADAMGDLVPYRSPSQQKDGTSYLGMVIFLLSWAVLFAGLFFAYGMLRAKAPVWPPPGTPRLPLGLPTVNTLLLLASSACLQGSILLFRRARVRTAAGAIGVTAVLGAVFLVFQIVVWQRMREAGLTPQAGQYASVFYALTWFHAAHVAVGVVAMIYLAVRGFFGRYSAARHHVVKLWAIYWHFVGIVWGLIFLLVYLV